MSSSLAILFSLLSCGGVGLEPSVADSMAPSEFLAIEPEGTIDFGRRLVNDDPPLPNKTIVLSGDGEGQLAIIDVWLQDSASGTFKLPSDDLPLPLIIKPGGEFRVKLRFAPTEVVSYTGELNIMYDDGTAEGAVVSRPLAGSGCTAC